MITTPNRLITKSMELLYFKLRVMLIKKDQRFTASGFKDIEIRKKLFVIIANLLVKFYYLVKILAWGTKLNS